MRRRPALPTSRRGARTPLRALPAAPPHSRPKRRQRSGHLNPPGGHGGKPPRPLALRQRPRPRPQKTGRAVARGKSGGSRAGCAPSGGLCHARLGGVARGAGVGHVAGGAVPGREAERRGSCHADGRGNPADWCSSRTGSGRIPRTSSWVVTRPQ